MNRFQYTLRMLRLLDKTNYRYLPRTPEGMLYYLGELIAAQNYSVQLYRPQLFIVSEGTHRLVDFFVVQRGVSANAAVQITLNGEGFYVHGRSSARSMKPDRCRFWTWYRRQLSWQRQRTPCPRRTA
ncbi:hypothetical protein [Bradyrhizobium liaoningense]|uniref:hypothetical protein n=1 Tax=Bradyrhizobium liaoningense TaxID=43992 RepID=UPI001BAB8E86|nr:hypothetical protein [Bradyrhizobium liaoningense]MBR1029377.1 hypothetical protein [Bradyrhizobium liaoningense]